MQNNLKILGLMIMVGLSGCSTYGDVLDCPVPKDGIKCRSISDVANEVEHDLTNSRGAYDNVIYVRG